MKPLTIRSLGYMTEMLYLTVFNEMVGEACGLAVMIPILIATIYTEVSGFNTNPGAWENWISRLGFPGEK